MESIPTPALTSRYLNLKDLPSAARLRQAEAAEADDLAAEFKAAVADFQEFSALPTRTFYDQDPDLRDQNKSAKSDTRTYGWGMAMKKGAVSVDGDPDLNFAYLDREIVPTRTKPGRKGPKLEVDLVLANVMTGRPIVSELKIASDKDPYTGLVQALAGAAQMISDSQRERLDEHAGRDGVSKWFAGPLATKEQEPKIDVYVLLADFPEVGRDRFKQLGRAVDLAAKLEKKECEGIARVRILAVSKNPDGSVAASTNLPI
jgi:hypothetical protein